MDHLERIQNFFFLNQVVYIASMLIAYYARRSVLLIASAIGLLVSLYIFEEDYGHPDVWTLDQIAILAVLLPDFVGWLGEKPGQHLISGMFFTIGLMFYVTGFILRQYGHHSDKKVRERWHLIMHMMSFLGHVTLIFGFFF